jgi:hypothetical protein
MNPSQTIIDGQYDGDGVIVGVGVRVNVGVTVGVVVVVGVGVTHIDSKQYIPENDLQGLDITDGEPDIESLYAEVQLSKLIALIRKLNGLPAVLVQVPSPLMIAELVKIYV